MAQSNQAPKPALTHEGTRVSRLTPEEELKRAVLTCLLWEDQHYEEGISIAERIQTLVPQVKVEKVLQMAVEARTRSKLRHVPLFLLCSCAASKAHHKGLAEAVEACIQRPDELGELLAIYAKLNNRTGRKQLNRIAYQLQKGIKKAFLKFSEYQFAKYRGGDKAIKLRDVMFLTHPKPSDEALFKKIASNTLETPDTWEVALSKGGPLADKKAIWGRLLAENKLGALALLRNLRNMQQAGVAESAIREALDACNTERVLPFRFVAAARYAPRLEPELEGAMSRCLKEFPRFAGRTALVVDTSPSMWGAKVSAKSEMDRFDAAAALAILVREVCEDPRIYCFNEKSYVIPTRRGFALRDAMASTKNSYSRGGLAIEAANEEGYDRIIVLTDGQWHSSRVKPSASTYYEEMADAEKVCPDPLTARAYLINLASYKNGVGYGRWHVINGWSESVLQYIQALEGGAN